MRYNQFQKIRKRQKEALLVCKTSEDQKPYIGGPDYSDVLEYGEVEEQRTEMRDPVAKYMSSASPTGYSSRLYPGEQVSGRWDFEERQTRQDPKADLIAKHFPGGTPRARSETSHLASTKKFDFEEALKRIDDRKELMAKHLSPRSKSIKMHVSSSPRVEDKSREIPVKHSGSHRTKSYLTRQQHAVRKFKYQYVEDDGDGHYDVVSNVVGKGRSSVTTTSPKLGNFLPVATPYSRADPPSNDEGSVYIPESRSNFEAPGQIDVIQAPSYETRTDISDVTGLDFAFARQTNPRNHGVRTLYSPRSVEHTAPPVEYLQGLKIKSEQPWRTGALAKHRPPQIEIDLTSIETVEDAIKSVRNAESRSAIHVEKRHGLPYECTDFRADDECSEDSWGRAIVTPKENLLHSITSTREPIDVEKLFAEHSMPTDTLSYVTDVETLIPRDVDIRDLIKETVSIEGDLVVDVSELREDHVQTLQSPRTKPQQALFNKITNEALAPVSFEQKPERMVGAEPPVTVSKHWTTTDNLAIDTILADHQSNPPSPLQLAALKSQVHNNDSVPSPSPANDFLFSSLETSTKYLKMLADGIGSQGKMLADGIGSQGKVLADGIGSQLSKLDSHLLPENEMNSMLGILDKDLKATSSKIPEGKEVVDYLDRQIKMNSVAAGDILICTSAKNMAINFRANSIDEMVDNVKQTYEKNVAICVGSALEEQMPPPQTFIVPISLRGKDVDDSDEQQQSLRILSPRLVEK